MGPFLESYVFVELFFPYGQPNGYSTSSAYSLLRLLSDFFFMHVDPHAAPRECTSMHTKVMHGPAVLTDLLALKNTLPPTTSSPILEYTSEVEDEEPAFFAIKKKKGTGRKQAAPKGHRRTASTINESAFRALGQAIPTSSEEADLSMRTILREQEEILVVSRYSRRRVLMGSALKQHLPTRNT